MKNVRPSSVSLACFSPLLLIAGLTPISVATAQTIPIQMGLSNLQMLQGATQSLPVSYPASAGSPPVTVSLSSLPSGVTASPAQLTLQPGGLAVFQIVAGASAQTGQQTLTLLENANGTIQDISLPFVLDQASPLEQENWNDTTSGLLPRADYSAFKQSAAQIYDVTSATYGAKGDGINDDAPAINQAIAQAIADGNTANDGRLRLVYIPSGTYLLKTAASGANAFLTIYHGDNIGILGDAGTTLLSTSSTDDWFQVFAVNKLTVASLVLDSAERWFTQGTVTALDDNAKTVDIQIDGGYDDPDPATRPDLAAVAQLRVFSDPAYMTYDQTVLPTIVSRQKLSSGLWRFTLDISPPSAYLNKKVAIWPANGRGTGLDLNVVGSLRVTDVQVYPRGGGSSLGVSNTSEPAFFGNFLQGRRSGELIGGTGGTFEQNNRGVFSFTHCDISGNDDDGFDFHTFATVVNAQVSSREIVIPTSTDFYAVGDTVSVIDWVQQAVRDEATITGITSAGDGRHLLLDRNVTVLRAGTADPSNDPSGLLDRTWSNTVQSNSMLTYNNISSMRARGLLIKGAPGGVIHGNYFHDVPSTALMAAPEIYWSEGPQNADMEISDNTFVNNSLSNIWVGIVTGNSTYSANAYDNSNIRITGNSFSGWGRHPQPYVTGIYGPAVAIDNTDTVTVSNNSFETPDPALPSGTAALQFGVSRNCTVSGNTGTANSSAGCN